MATPSLHRSFDASLIDMQQSFSSTETNTSGSASSAKENQQPKLPPTRDNAPGRVVKEGTTGELYAQWANTYDSDGNFLQATDDIQTNPIFPELLRHVQGNSNNSRLQILDLGCGTGRTTMKLIQSTWDRSVVINAWDASDAMLAVARKKCSSARQASPQARDLTLHFERVDCSQPVNVHHAEKMDAVVSTLVLEHLPLEAYWQCIRTVLKPGGYGFVSNMHPDMGGKSVAGFDDEEGKRVIGRSWVHGVMETVQAAESAGMEILGEVKESEVTTEMIRQGLVSERGKKWIGTKVWYGFMYRRRL